jgi:Rieske Fe-S protein
MEPTCQNHSEPSRRRFLGLIPGVLGAASVASGITVAAESEADAAALAWPKIAKASSIAVGGNFVFSFKGKSQYNVPGVQGIIHRSAANTYECWVLYCTHNGCSLVPNGATANCPCHGSRFNLTTGMPGNGPAVAKMYSATITIKSDGYIYYVKDNL